MTGQVGKNNGLDTHKARFEIDNFRSLNNAQLRSKILPLHTLNPSNQRPEAQDTQPGPVAKRALRLFISYNFEDLPLVTPLRAEFKKEGCSVWIAEEDAGAGPWPPQISVAIQNCDVFILALTRRSRDSLMVQNEILEAHKRARQMLIVRLESGVDNGDWGPVLNVWQRFDWVPSQIPRILQQIQKIADHLAVQASGQAAELVSVAPRAKPVPWRTRWLAAVAVTLLVGGIALLYFRSRAGGGKTQPTDPRQELVLLVLPSPNSDQIADDQQLIKVCSSMRAPLQMAFGGAKKVWFCPQKAEPGNLVNAAREFTDPHNSLFTGLEPTYSVAPCMALVIGFSKEDGPNRLWIYLRVRDQDGNFSPCSYEWIKFYLKNAKSFRVAADHLDWTVARASVEVTRFLVDEGVVKTTAAEQDHVLENLTRILLEAMLRNSSATNAIPPDLLVSDLKRGGHPQLERLLQQIDSGLEGGPSLDVMAKAKVELKANIAPFFP